MVDAGERADVVLEHVLAASGYLKELEDSEDPQDETRVENLAELVAVAREFADEPTAGPSADPADPAPAAPGLPDFLERVALVADSDQIPDQVSESAGVVTLMTLHTAKGLEFPVVFLTGLEDGVFPHQRSLGDRPELEEERRLAYVGLTRAQQRLYVSRAVVRSAWGAPVAQPAVAVPRRAAARPRRLAPHPGGPDVVEPPGAAVAAAAQRRPADPALRLRRGPRRRRRPRPAPRGPVALRRRPGAARLVRHGQRRRARGLRRPRRRLHRLRLPGRQAAAAPLRPRREALALSLRRRRA